MLIVSSIARYTMSPILRRYSVGFPWRRSIRTRGMFHYPNGRMLKNKQRPKKQLESNRQMPPIHEVADGGAIAFYSRCQHQETKQCQRGSKVRLLSLPGVRGYWRSDRETFGRGWSERGHHLCERRLFGFRRNQSD